MLRRICFQYFIVLAAIFTLSACQGDNDLAEKKEGGEPLAETTAKIRFRIGTAYAPTATRVWQDGENAEDREMMNLWTVIIVNASNDIVAIYTCNPASDAADTQREVDDVAELELAEAEVGKTYRAYSFANISASKLESILGLTSGTIPAPDEAGTVVSRLATDNNVTFSQKIFASGNDATGGPAEGVVPSEDIVTVNGNQFNAFTSTDDNGFDSYGIPMSNVQSFTVPAANAGGTATVQDLIVIRMFAKVELQLYNATSSPITVNKVTFGQVTKNTDNNLYLMPLVSEGTENNMEINSTYHAKIQPHLSGTPDKEDIVVTESKTVEASTWIGSAPVEGKTPTKISFYVNESVLPTDGNFTLDLQIGDAEYRYALINQTGATEADNDKWNYIARNDYRIIPIVLDDYRLEMIPYDFPEIGVYPASVREIDATQHLYEILFHDYGHFHLLPLVTHNGGTEEISFSATKPAPGTTAWTLYGAGTPAAADDWTNSFKSYMDADGTTEFTLTTNSVTTKFYGKPGASGLPAANVYPTALPAYGTAKDDSENGDWPVFYNPAGGEPYWVPVTLDESGKKRPYIFGQIAPQEAGADKKVFHEFKVNLYVSGSTTPRILTYRFYMHLKQDHATARPRAARCH